MTHLTDYRRASVDTDAHPEGDVQFFREIPAEIGQLTNLQYLELNNNQLTGPIPSEVGQMSNLQSLTLYFNQLTGSIPPELGQLSSIFRAISRIQRVLVLQLGEQQG